MNNTKGLLAAMLSVSLTLSFGVAAVPQTSYAAATVSASKGTQIVNFGARFLGTPYKLGARTGNTSSFDCSSFTQYVYKKNGIQLPRGARDQYRAGVKIKRSNLRVGDLVFFSTRATMKYSAGSINRIGHVGIYAGNNRVLHTYGPGGVKYNSMSSGWWDDHYVGAVRVIR